MHIGLLRRSAMGDVILWSALVEQCLRRYPSVSITWMIDPLFIPLFDIPTRLTWCPLPKPKDAKSYLASIKQLRQQRFDVLFCAQASLRSNVLYPFSSTKRKIGFDTKRGRDGHRLFVNERIPYHDNHLIEGFAQFFEQAGLPLDLDDLLWPIANTQILTQPKKTQHRAQRIGIVVAASKAERTWPVTHQITLISALIDTFPGKIVLIGGPSPDEAGLAQQIMAALSANTNRLENCVGQTSLTSLPQLISQLDCLVAPDTGPTHLARALNVPVIGLYAVARSALSGPYGGINTIDLYPEAAAQLLHKSADQLAWHDRVHHVDAMRLITPKRVLTEICKVIEL